MHYNIKEIDKIQTGAAYIKSYKITTAGGDEWIFDVDDLRIQAGDEYDFFAYSNIKDLPHYWDKDKVKKEIVSKILKK